MTADNEHRTFLLTLDADQGQDIAMSQGFTPPSEDVAQRETRQVFKDWALLDAEGILPQLMEYSKWFSEVVLPEEATDEDKVTTIHSFVTFGAAAIARLKVRGLLDTSAKLIPILHDEQGHPINDSYIPEELVDLSVEMDEYLKEQQ